MKYFISKESVLKWLETPCVYHIQKDELYELDFESFELLKSCSTNNGGTSEDREFINYCLKEDILTTDRVSEKHIPLIKSPVPSLRYLELQITDKCNLRCRHCYIGDSERVTVKGNELSVKQIRDVLMEFEKMQGLRVLITGGEPLLHSNFKEINKMLPDFSIRKILFTNGLLLNNEILKTLNVEEIQISIDGLAKAHDSLRGRGNFKKSMAAVKQSIDSGFEVSVSTMVHPENLCDFDEMERLFKTLGIKDWTVDVPCITGRLKENSEFKLPPEQGGRYLRYGYGNGLHEGAQGFGCGLHLMSVTAEGRASKCTFYSDRHVGEISEGLKECWKGISPVRLDELKCDCVHIESCRGGCRFRAELLGDPSGKDLYRCISYDII